MTFVSNRSLVYGRPLIKEKIFREYFLSNSANTTLQHQSVFTFQYLGKFVLFVDSFSWVKPSLSMKILSINNFTTKLLSKLLSDLYIGVHLKGTKKFGSKVINRQFFHRKTVFHMKILSIINFTTKLLSIKDYFLNGLQ